MSIKHFDVAVMLGLLFGRYPVHILAALLVTPTEV